MNPIASARPQISQSPFAYCVVDDFLSAPFYERLRARNQLWHDSRLFRPFTVGYDAAYYNPEPTLDTTDPVSFFFSRELHSYVAQLFNRPALTDDVYVGSHYHAAGGIDGFPHSDFNLVSMINPCPLANGINPWRGNTWHDGRWITLNYADDTANRQPNTYKVMRSITLIYYLNNPEGWRDGDGGETGLYNSLDPTSLFDRIAPRNNRLLAFACSPHSYHGYLKSHSHIRNTIISWYHELPEIQMNRHSTREWEYWRYPGSFTEADQRWQP